MDFFDPDEIKAPLRAPDTQTRAARRDLTLLLVPVQTGLRASELIHLRCEGKGRK